VTIRSLKSNVSQGDVIRTFSSRGFSNRLWQIRNGSLQRIASAYVPYWLYQARFAAGKAAQTRLFALDAVEGSLDLFEFPRLPYAHEIVSIETRNFLQPSLTEACAEELLREKILHLIFQQGFFRLRERILDIAREPVELYLPYWLGFYGKRGTVHCRVMDGVRRRVEGAKASAFFEQWLAA
jgi:hypothetical protein